MREFLDPFECQRAPGGLRWWPTGKTQLTNRAQEVLRSLASPGGNDIEPLKQSTRRCVLRLRGAFPPAPSVIVKGFPLARLESRFKYRKYGLTEFINYHRAAERSMPAPACLGYFEVRSLGMVSANGVVIEDLVGWRSLAELAETNLSQQLSILSAAIPLLKFLFETGTNHIDTSPQNILQSPDGKFVKLIDWQYCSFVEPRQITQLALQAAHFLNYAKLAATSSVAQSWIADLAVTCQLASEANGLRAAIDALQQQGKLSGDDRLALRLSATASKALQPA